MTSVEDLQAKIKDLEEKLLIATQKNVARQKIKEMSSEVVDSNPYRCVISNYLLFLNDTTLLIHFLVD